MNAAEISARITCMACAVATGKVKVTSFDPFTVSPADLLQKKFSEVAIDSATRMTVFKRAVADIVKDEAIGSKVLDKKVSPQSKIGIFADFLEGLLLESEN